MYSTIETDGKNYKADRIMKLFFRALKGESLSVSSLAKENNVSTRSVTRDINDLKAFLADYRDVLGNAELVYSSSNHCYTLEMDNLFTNKELFAISKVLVGSKAFSHEELLTIINKLKTHTSYADKKRLEHLLSNELFHYTAVGSDCDSVIDTVWNLSSCIHDHKSITIQYIKMNRTRVSHKIIPLSIMFSEYYFYLIACKAEDDTHNLSPVYFRIDRITGITVHRREIPLSVSSKLSFDEGLLRKRSQFMWPGSLRTIRFEFTGPSIQAILDRLPTAKIVDKQAGSYIVEAEIYGDGIKMYLLSQGAWVKVLSPASFVEEMREEIRKMHSLYEQEI